MEGKWKQWQALFSWASKSQQTVTAAMKLKDASPWKKRYNKPRQHIKKQRHYFADKSPSSRSYGFSSSHVWMWELNHKERWVSKNWCFLTAVLEKILESSLYSKEIKPVNSKGNQPWIFIGRTDAEAEAAILWPPSPKSRLIGKELDAGKDWGQKERGATTDEIVGWYHWLNGHEFEQAPGASEGQGRLVCCNAWVAKSQTQLSNWTTGLLEEAEEQS